MSVKTSRRFAGLFAALFLGAAGLPGFAADEAEGKWWERASDQASSRHAIHIRADIDGRSQLVIHGSAVHWYHIAWAAPGREAGRNLPTYINGQPWYPEWPRPGRNDFGKCKSSTYELLEPALPSAPVTVRLTTHEARGPVTIAEQPRAANDYTLIVDFNDRSQSGSDWYDVTIEWSGRAGDPAGQATTDTIVLDVRVLNLSALKSEGRPDERPPLTASVDLLALTNSTTSVAVAGIPSYGDFVRALEQQATVNVRLNHRMFVKPGELFRIELGSENPADADVLMICQAAVIDRRKLTMELKMHFKLSGRNGLRGRELTDIAEREHAGEKIEFERIGRVRSGDTAYLTLEGIGGAGAHERTLLLLTPHLMVYQE